MLQPKHLAIARASLTYWDEEMGAEPESVYRHYLHSQDFGTTFAPIDIANVRREFNKATIKYALLDSVNRELVAGSLVDDGASLTAQSHQQIVAVLL